MCIEEYEILLFDLNHGLGTQQKESDIIASILLLWDQINRSLVRKHITMLTELKIL